MNLVPQLPLDGTKGLEVSQQRGHMMAGKYPKEQNHFHSLLSLLDSLQQLPGAD